MNKLVYKMVIAFVMSSIIFSCSSPKGNAEVRIAQLLLMDTPLKIQLNMGDSIVYNHDLAYTNVTDYINLTSGIYELNVFDADRLILKKKIGLGTDGKYTLYLFGMPIAGEETNTTTLEFDLDRAVEGEEASSSNGLMPQVKILNDIFNGDSSTAKIRWIHAAPGVESLSGSAVHYKKNDTIALKKLNYAEKSQLIDIKPGKINLFWTLGIKDRKISETTSIIDSSTIYNVFLLPDPDEYIDGLNVIIQSNNAD